MPETSFWRGLRTKLSSPRIPPAVIPSQFFQGVVILMAGIASIFQGLDYIARGIIVNPNDTAWALTVVEKALPFEIWGYGFIVFSLLAIIGDTFQVWPFAIFGHGALFICYSTIGVGVFASLMLEWKGYGWQLGFLYAGVGLFHAMVADGCYDQWAREWDHPPAQFDKES